MLAAVCAAGALLAVAGIIAGVLMGANSEVTVTAPAPAVESPAPAAPAAEPPAPAAPIDEPSATAPAEKPVLAPAPGSEAASPSPAQPPASVVWQEEAKSVVMVLACPEPARVEDECRTGSGTVVGDGLHILTNHHVVYGVDSAGSLSVFVLPADDYKSEPAPEDAARARIVAADEPRDIAVLAVDAYHLSGGIAAPVQVSATDLRLGENITILGYPGDGGHSITLTQGVFSGMWSDPSEPGITWLKTDADLAPGNSGGAAFNQAGEFVGVPTGGVAEVGLLIPADEAARFLEQAIGRP